MTFFFPLSFGRAQNQNEVPQITQVEDIQRKKSSRQVPAQLGYSIICGNILLKLLKPTSGVIFPMAHLDLGLALVPATVKLVCISDNTNTDDVTLSCGTRVRKDS